MDMFLQNIQSFFFGLGADKDFCVWDRVGNSIQDFRTKFTIKK